MFTPIRFSLLLGVALLPAHALAQRSQENAAASASDAFGRSVGNESVGLYASGEVRGFSAADAGNARIEGLYFSRAGKITELLQAGSSIRVGITAFGQNFPAPTGIIDTDLRRVTSPRPVITARASSGDFLGADYTLEAALPITGRLGFYGVVGRFDDRYFDGTDGNYLSHGAVLRWQARPKTELTGYFSFYTIEDEEQGALIYPATAALPSPIARRHYSGQDWADIDGFSRNYGAVAKSSLGNWRIALGLFQSDLVQHRTASQWFANVGANGVGQFYLRTARDQSYSTTSGEARLAREWAAGVIHHRLTASLRGRFGNSDYGGFALQDLGLQRIGQSMAQVQMREAYGVHTIDKVQQRQWGLGYDLIWNGRGEINLGLVRNDYRKSVTLPGHTVQDRQESGWLWNAAFALHVTRQFSLYAASTRGLEESGTAPGNAANAGEVMPALRTRQVEAGLRWHTPIGMHLVADWFDLAKPYFETDSLDNTYRIMGEVRHSGLELSLSGALAKGIKLVAGAVLLDPKVSGKAVDEGRLGRRPIGRTATLVDASLDWRLAQGRSRWSFDARMLHEGRREADARNLFSIPAITTIDLGARYRFKLGRSDALIRAKIANTTNNFGWRVASGGGLRTNIPRRVSIALTVDF